MTDALRSCDLQIQGARKTKAGEGRKQNVDGRISHDDVGRELIVMDIVEPRADVEAEDASGLERRLVGQRQQATRLLLVRADEDAGERLLRRRDERLGDAREAEDVIAFEPARDVVEEENGQASEVQR